MIDAAVSCLARLFPEVLIIANDPEPFSDLDVPVIPDLIPDRGALGGLYTGLSMASYPRAFFAACDMPFLNPDLIRLLVREADDWEVVLPSVGGELHPMHAVYAKSCLPHIKASIDSGTLKIASFFSKVRVKTIEESLLRTVDPDLLGLMNVNTPPELERAEAIRRQRSRLDA